MKISKVDHIGIAVKDLEEALKLYRDILQLEVTGVEEVPDQKVKVAFIPVGESKVELLEPTTDDSPVAKFIAKRGKEYTILPSGLTTWKRRWKRLRRLVFGS